MFEDPLASVLKEDNQILDKKKTPSFYRRKSVSFLEVETLNNRNRIMSDTNCHEIISEKCNHDGVKASTSCCVELDMIKIDEGQGKNRIDKNIEDPLLLDDIYKHIPGQENVNLKISFADSEKLENGRKNNVLSDSIALNNLDFHNKKDKPAFIDLKENMINSQNVKFTQSDTIINKSCHSDDDMAIPDSGCSATSVGASLTAPLLLDTTRRMTSQNSTGKLFQEYFYISKHFTIH